jgi:hypothetical protein
MLVYNDRENDRWELKLPITWTTIPWHGMAWRAKYLYSYKYLDPVNGQVRTSWTGRPRQAYGAVV